LRLPPAAEREVRYSTAEKTQATMAPFIERPIQAHAVQPCAAAGSPSASPSGTKKSAVRRARPATSRAVFVSTVLFVVLVPLTLHREIIHNQVFQEQLLMPPLKGWREVEFTKDEKIATMAEARVATMPENNETQHWPQVKLTNEEKISSTTEVVVATLPESNQIQPAKYAYAYLIGGCKPEAPSYRYYFYDILINTHLQRLEGSTADVVVFVQMKFDSAHDRITEEDQHLFNAMNITVEYIPKAKDESFYRLMHDKFLILRMTQYKRVMFLDGDGLFVFFVALHFKQCIIIVHTLTVSFFLFNNSDDARQHGLLV